MNLSGKFITPTQKGVRRIKSMVLFRRQSSKRKNSRNLVKRYFRLIR